MATIPSAPRWIRSIQFPDFSDPSPTEAVSRIPVMVAAHDDLDTIQLLLKEHVIREFHEIQTAQARGIIIEAFWERGNSIHRGVQFPPKSIHQIA